MSHGRKANEGSEAGAGVGRYATSHSRLSRCNSRQTKSVSDLLRKAQFDQCNPTLTPMPTKQTLRKRNEEEEVADAFLYRSLTRSLLYLTHTRPDIAIAVHQVSQFMQAPTKKHLYAVNCILRYIKGTQNYGLLYGNESNSALNGYADADWGANLDDRKSITRYIYFYLEQRQSLGEFKNSLQWPYRLLKQNIWPLARPVVNVCGSVKSLKNLKEEMKKRLLKFVVIIHQQFFLLKTRLPINEASISIYDFILYEIKSNLAQSKLFSALPTNIMQIYFERNDDLSQDKGHVLPACK